MLILITFKVGDKNFQSISQLVKETPIKPAVNQVTLLALILNRTMLRQSKLQVGV
jgi:hypothetical protein